MKNIKWDSGYRWGDPNLRWGNPSFVLEPGDPGYVGPVPLPEQKRKRKMIHAAYYPSRQAEQVLWLTNFMITLPGLATALGLSSGQNTAAVNDCGWLIYVMQDWLTVVRSFSPACTDAVAEAQTGAGSAAQTLPVFTAPTLPTGVVAVKPGALNRLFDLIQQLKDSGFLTDVMATSLGIVGSVKTGPDMSTVQPVLGAKINGSVVEIKWGWGGNSAFLSSCEIRVDRSDTHGFVLLTIDTTPNYTDTQAFPSSMAEWKYKAIYRSGDAQVGIWSAPVSVFVGAGG